MPNLRAPGKLVNVQRVQVLQVGKANHQFLRKPCTDMYVSSLRSCIETMGGKLDIVARFPHGSVVITSLLDAGEDRVEAGPVPDAERP